MGEFGHGLVTAVHDDSGQLFAELLGTNGFAFGTIRLDSLDNTAAPLPVATMAGSSTDLVAWQQNSGPGTPAEIRARYSADGFSFGPELVISSPALGPTNAAGGLAAAGDFSGKVALAWVQGTGDSTQIVVDQLYQPPSAFAATAKFRYVRSARPVLSWSQSRDHWGPVRYAVTIDQAQIYQTSSTSLLVPGLLGQRAARVARHRLQPGRARGPHASGQGVGRHRATGHHAHGDGSQEGRQDGAHVRDHERLASVGAPGRRVGHCEAS